MESATYRDSTSAAKSTEGADFFEFGFKHAFQSYPEVPNYYDVVFGNNRQDCYTGSGPSLGSDFHNARPVSQPASKDFKIHDVTWTEVPAQGFSIEKNHDPVLSEVSVPFDAPTLQPPKSTRPSAATRMKSPLVLGKLRNLKRTHRTALKKDDIDAPTPDTITLETENTRSPKRHRGVQPVASVSSPAIQNPDHEAEANVLNQSTLSSEMKVNSSDERIDTQGGVLQSYFFTIKPTLDDEDKIQALVYRLKTLFGNKEEYKKFLECRNNAQKVLDLFQRLLDIVVDPSPSDTKARSSIRTLPDLV